MSGTGDLPDPSAPPDAAREALFAALVRADRSSTFGPLAARLAHELTDLLTTMLAAVSLAKDRGDVSGLAGAQEAALAARELVRRLLALAKGGDGSRALVAPRELLAEVEKNAAAGSAAEIEIRVDAETDLVRVDRESLLQAFGNLVRNALEAMPPPPHPARLLLSAANAALEEGRIEGLPAGDYVEFEVRDNGAGIPADDLEKIWEPFFTTKKHGAGLGLAAALAIVRRHGGQIGVDSVPGEGTVFTVFLPRADPHEDVRGRRAAARRFATGRVLVMEDDDRIRALTGAMLENLGYKADLARSLGEAVATYRRYFEVGRPHDAVILDLDAPDGLGGAEAFRDLAAIDPDVRAIAVGRDGEESQACLDLGFSGWLGKPYRPAELGSVLKTVIGD